MWWHGGVGRGTVDLFTSSSFTTDWIPTTNPRQCSRSYPSFFRVASRSPFLSLTYPTPHSFNMNYFQPDLLHSYTLTLVTLLTLLTQPSKQYHQGLISDQPGISSWLAVHTAGFNSLSALCIHIHNAYLPYVYLVAGGGRRRVTTDSTFPHIPYPLASLLTGRKARREMYARGSHFSPLFFALLEPSISLP